MNTVAFGQYDSYADLNLLLTEKKIGTPDPKTELIDVPGGDGVIDLTEFFGEVKYKNRKLAFTFETISKPDFLLQFSTVQNLLHGQKTDIYLSDDNGWYYTGRVSVNEWKADRGIGRFTVDCDCEPYKHKYTAQTVSLAGRNLIDLDAGTMATAEWTKTTTGYSFTRKTSTAGSFVHFSVPVARGKTYIFSADYSLTTRLLYVYRDKLFGDLVAKSENGKPCIFTPEHSGIYVFGLYVTSAAADGAFTNVMLAEGNEKGAYTAYDTASKTVTAVFNNTRRPAMPIIYASKQMTVETPSNFLTLNPGMNMQDFFTFYQGENSLTFKGNGVAVVEWREGAL